MQRCQTEFPRFMACLFSIQFSIVKLIVKLIIKLIIKLIVKLIIKLIVKLIIKLIVKLIIKLIVKLIHLNFDPIIGFNYPLSIKLVQLTTIKKIVVVSLI